MDCQKAGWFKMTLKTFLFLFFISALVLSSQVPSFKNDVETQSADLNSSGDGNSSINQDSPVRSSAAETVARAGKDLNHSEEGRRVGAAKLLGKYQSSQASIFLIGALDDQSALVRRAVMVSLAEHVSNGFYISDRSLIEKIYSKLGDTDVEVRRETSAMIPRIMSGMMRSGVEIVEINGRKVFRSVPSSLRPDLLKMTQDAFLDEDAIVRQNILKYHTYLRVPLPLTTLEKLLSDPDNGVLLTALERISSNASQLRIVQRVKELSAHSEKGIRLKVVTVARDANRYHSGYRGILRGMTQDPDPEVLSMAAVELARFGERIPASVIENIKNYLLSVNGLSTQVTTILYTISAMGVDGVSVYLALTEHSSSKIRAIAWQRFISLSNGWNDSSKWLPVIKDPDKQVRQGVLNALRGRTSGINEEELGLLVDSQYSDVRIFAAQSLLNAKQEAVEALGFDLLIDEDTIVRSSTIRAISARRVPGWLKVMSRSLLDDNYVIQRAAMDGLLEDQAEGIPLLLNYVSNNPQTRISNLIQNELRRIGVQP